MRTTIITAVYGDWDTVKPPVPQDARPDVEWLLVTDDPDIDAEGWHVIVEDRPHVHPCLAAKVPKFRPDLYARPDAEMSVWIDASAVIGPRFLLMCDEALDRANMAMFPHPHRTQLGPEVECSRTLPKYDDLPLEAQVAHYLGHVGFPDCELWASGAIARRHGVLANNDIIRFGDAWLSECVRWGFQDQLSLSYLLWRFRVVPGILGPSLFTSPHIEFGPHR